MGCQQQEPRTLAPAIAARLAEFWPPWSPFPRGAPWLAGRVSRAVLEARLRGIRLLTRTPLPGAVLESPASWLDVPYGLDDVCTLSDLSDEQLVQLAWSMCATGSCLHQVSFDPATCHLAVSCGDCDGGGGGGVYPGPWFDDLYQFLLDWLLDDADLSGSAWDAENQQSPNPG